MTVGQVVGAVITAAPYVFAAGMFVAASGPLAVILAGKPRRRRERRRRQREAESMAQHPAGSGLDADGLPRAPLDENEQAAWDALLKAYLEPRC